MKLKRTTVAVVALTATLLLTTIQSNEVYASGRKVDTKVNGSTEKGTIEFKDKNKIDCYLNNDKINVSFPLTVTKTNNILVPINKLVQKMSLKKSWDIDKEEYRVTTTSGTDIKIEYIFKAGSNIVIKKTMARGENRAEILKLKDNVRLSSGDIDVPIDFFEKEMDYIISYNTNTNRIDFKTPEFVMDEMVKTLEYVQKNKLPFNSKHLEKYFDIHITKDYIAITIMPQGDGQKAFKAMYKEFMLNSDLLFEGGDQYSYYDAYYRFMENIWKNNTNKYRYTNNSLLVAYDKVINSLYKVYQNAPYENIYILDSVYGQSIDYIIKEK